MRIREAKWHKRAIEESKIKEQALRVERVVFLAKNGDEKIEMELDFDKDQPVPLYRSSIVVLGEEIEEDDEYEEAVK
jgi:hypothetical protein